MNLHKLTVCDHISTVIKNQNSINYFDHHSLQNFP